MHQMTSLRQEYTSMIYISPKVHTYICMYFLVNRENNQEGNVVAKRNAAGKDLLNTVVKLSANVLFISAFVIHMIPEVHLYLFTSSLSGNYKSKLILSVLVSLFLQLHDIASVLYKKGIREELKNIQYLPNYMDHYVGTPVLSNEI